MKNNQYIEKYGEKALELFNRKSMRDALMNYNGQLSDGQQQVQQKKSKSKLIQRTQKSKSQKNLNRTEKSKSKLILNGNDNNNCTFQKPLNIHNLCQKDKNRKKLIISGLSTPINKHSRLPSSNYQQRIPSSTKKKNADVRISQKLNDALYKAKSTKSIVKQLLECLDMISQHQCKINKWLNQFKDIVYHIADRAAVYQKKYKQECIKNKKIQKQMQELQINFKVSADKKRKPIEMVIMEENQKLKEKVQKLQLKIQNFEKKQMVLIETLEKMKSPHNKHNQTNSMSKKQEYWSLNNMKGDFYQNLDQNDEDEDFQQQSQENQ